VCVCGCEWLWTVDAGFRIQDSGCRMQDAVDAAAPLGMTK